MDKPAIEGGTPIRQNKPFLVFGSPAIDQEEIDAVAECMRTRWIGTGPRVAEFERNFAAYKDARYSMAVNSCTAALHLSMMASGIGDGDEVITTPMTFCATVNSIIHTGATPVLADCDRDTMNISPQAIEDKITARTKAIVIVHFAGRACEMDAIMEIARKYNVMLIEDCAHAIETEYHGRKAGTFGDLGCFSFYVTKNITTGEGGMVITQDERLAGKVKVLALHGMSKDAWKRFSDEGYRHYEVLHPGYKYNMMDMQAVMGISQLKKVDAFWSRRQQIWEIYNRSFADLACILPHAVETETKHGYHLYTPLVQLERLRVSRDHILAALQKENIGIGVHYVPVHLHPFYRKTYGWKHGDYPNAEFIGDRTVSLPLAANMTDSDVDDVVRAFRRILTFYAQ